MSANGDSSLGIREALARVVDRRDLTSEEMASVVGEIMDGKATPAQIGALLAAMRMKGETVDEMSGMVDAMLELMPSRTAASSPPAITANWPFSAPDWPPDTGASTNPAPEVRSPPFVSPKSAFSASG